MDVLTEHTCPDCQGTGAWLNPGDCSTCAGRGTITHAEYRLRLLGEINAQLAGIRARQDQIAQLQREITAGMAILGQQHAMLTGVLPDNCRYGDGGRLIHGQPCTCDPGFA